MDPRGQIKKGMTVYTGDGEKLGKVAVADDTGLFVEKGLFFPKEYGFRYDDVEDIRADGVHLRVNKDAILRQESSRDPGSARNDPGPTSTDRDRAETSTVGATPGNPPPAPPARSGLESDVDTRSTRRAEGLTIPMVGEGIAPMLVEEEVVVVRESPPATTEERRSSPGERSPDATSTSDRKDPRHG